MEIKFARGVTAGLPANASRLRWRGRMIPKSGAGPLRYNLDVNAVDAARVDRSAFEIGSLGDDRKEIEYWRGKSPEERMEALELMRQIIYGYDPATTRLQRVFEVVDLERS